MSAETADQPYIEQDGYLIDPETGEVVGLTGEWREPGRFAVDTIAAAEWVIDKMAAEQGEIDKLQARAKEILANLQSMTVERERRLGWLHTRFDGELQALVERETAGKRQKSIKTLYGMFGLRTNPSRLVVTDEAAALDWALREAPQIVRHSVTKTDALAVIGNGEERLDVPWVLETTPEERLFVSFAPRGHSGEAT